MEETIFKEAVAALNNGNYSESDVRVVREWLQNLNKKELTIKRAIERMRNEFVRQKEKSNSELKTVRSDIKSIQNLLKTA